MRSLISVWLTLTVLCALSLSSAFAQAPMIYGVIFDKISAQKISEVLPGGPGNQAGIQAGDLLVAINGLSTSGLTNEAIRAALIKQTSASVTINRNGQRKTVSMSKAPMDSFGRTCVWGNCETGKGRLRMANYGNMEFEGQFENGVPGGEFKVYNDKGFFFYRGSVKNFTANGNGKLYDKDSNGGFVITEEGDYVNGDLANGIRYNTDGSVLSSGQYEPGPARKLKSVYRLVAYRGRTCDIFVEKIRRGPNGAIYNGKVTIRELESDNPDARKLLELYYVDGVPHGNATVWDYENGVYHFMQYRNGVLREDGLNAGMIFRIADKVPIASEIRYAADATVNNDWPNRIVYGLFHFRSKFLTITGPSGGSSLATFKQLYDNGAGQVFDPNAAQTTAGNNGNSGSGANGAADLMNGVDPGHTPAQVLEATKAFISINEWNDTQIQKLTEIANGINKHNYTRAREQFEALQSDIVSSYTVALYKYKGAIPAKLWFAMESKRNKIKALQVPSYVQY